MITPKQAMEYPCKLLNLDNEFQKAYQEKGDYWNVIVVNAHEKNGILVIDVYSQSQSSSTNEAYYLGKKIQEDQKNRFGERLPSFRVFFDISQKRWLFVNPEAKKVTEATIAYALSYWFYGHCRIYLNESNSNILTYFNESPEKDAITTADYWQQEIIKERKAKIYQKSLFEVSSLNTKIKKLPANFDEFIKNNTMKKWRFAFFHRQGKKRPARCSHCGHAFELEQCYIDTWTTGGIYKINPRNQVSCPECKSLLIVLAEKKLPQRIWNYKEQSILIQALKDNSGFVVRHFETIQECSSKNNNIVYPLKTIETCRQFYVDQRHEPKTFFHGYYKDTNKLDWQRIKDIYDKYFGISGSFRYHYIYRFDTFLYKNNIKKELSKTYYKYTNINLFYKLIKPKECQIHEYIKSFFKNPIIEILLKIRANKLACQIVKDPTSVSINIKKESLKDILKINANDLKLIIKYNLDHIYLKCLQIFKQCCTFYTYKSLKNAVLFKYDFNFLEELLKHNSLKKITNYLEKNNAGENFIRDWKDIYLNMGTLNIPITNSNLLFAKEFKKTHDNLYKQVVALQNFKNNKEFTAICEQFKDLFEYSNEEAGLCIVMPGSINDLVYEGHVLGHCVGTYSDRVLSGKSFIVFLRKSAEIATPYYTVQVGKDLTLIQCRTKGNESETPEVKTFVNLWLEEIKKRKQSAKTKRNNLTEVA